MITLFNEKEFKSFQVKIPKKGRKFSVHRHAECVSRDGAAHFETCIEVKSSIDCLNLKVIGKGYWETQRDERRKVSGWKFVPFWGTSTAPIIIELVEM